MSRRNKTRKLRGIERQLALKRKAQMNRFNKIRRGTMSAPVYASVSTRKAKLSKKELQKINDGVSMEVDRELRKSARLAGKTRNYRGLSGQKVQEIKKNATQKTMPLIYPSTFGPASGILRKKVDAAWKKRISELSAKAAKRESSARRNESNSLPADLVNMLNRSVRLSASTHRAPRSASRSANRRHLATIAENANEWGGENKRD
jgi:hypothetical protein